MYRQGQIRANNASSSRGIDAEGIVGPPPRPWRNSLPLSGSGYSYRQAHPRQHSPRQLQRELHLLRSARIDFEDFVGWAKRSVPTIQDHGERWWARRKGAFAHPTALRLGFADGRIDN